MRPFFGILISFHHDTFELLFNLSLESLQPPPQKKRVCKWVRWIASFDDDDGGGEGNIHKAWTKEEGQRKYGRKGIVILYKFFCTRMDTKSLKRQLKFA